MFGRFRLPEIGIFILFQLITCEIGFSQSLFIQREIQKANSRSSRSVDGKPGVNYWQNRAIYDLKAKVDPFSKTLKGSAEIKYYNNSPDTLKTIIFRLYPDLFMKGQASNVKIDPSDLTDGTDITKFNYNGKSIDIKASNVIREKCLLTIPLKNFIPPKDSASFEIEWGFSIPSKTFIRMGSYSESSAFIALWYPQIAVYDDIYGWDRLGYDGEHEFYNDFNSYKVEITAPVQFIVWGTGTPENLEENLSSNVYEKYLKATKSDTVIHIIEKEDIANESLTKKKPIRNGWNTWKFAADAVTDFAFGLSKEYVWDGLMAKADFKTDKKAFVSAVYDTGSKDFYEVAVIAKKSIEMMASVFPAVPYPFSFMTVFNGDGGMEFPMIVNDGSFSSRQWTVYVTSHEIAHTYFPFLVGINETKYSWMDEGMAVILPMDIQTIIEPSMKYGIITANSLSKYGGTEIEMPLMVPAYQLTGLTHTLAAYSRSGMAYYVLRDALGKEKFDSALRDYITNWAGKHPTPYDFFNSIETFSKTELNWFWKPWFFDFGYADLAIKNVYQEEGKYTVEVENMGTLPLPIRVVFDYGNGKIIVENRTAMVWKKGVRVVAVTSSEKGKPVKIKIENENVPDVNLTNNFYTVK